MPQIWHSIGMINQSRRALNSGLYARERVAEIYWEQSIANALIFSVRFDRKLI
jgi:hypothetical protein